jgi:lipopolysaccharide export system protein LptA
MRHLHSKIAALMLLITPAWCYGLTSDREQPINIEADHAQLDDKTGMAQYKGDAILTQGTLRITGDIITFYYDENQQLIKAVAQGKLATYKQLHKEGDTPVKAESLQMEYYTESQKIYLLGKGHLWQNGDEFTGNRIEYDINRNMVVANSAPITVGGEKQQKGRIHMIIQPSQKSTKKPETQPKPTPVTDKQVTSLTPAVKTATENTTRSAESYPTAITSSNLNMRSGPGTQYQKLGMLNANQQVIVLTRQPAWSQVRAVINDEVVIGWVNSRYLK